MSIETLMRRKRGIARTLRSFALAALAAAALFAASGSPASAREPYWRWHGDIHHFYGHDWDHWRGGHWYHGWHGGRYAWWWLVGGLWYSYAAPVYPYPNPYVPPAVVAAAPPATTYYYCANPAGYYPYVASCPAPWQAVPGRP